MKVGCSGVNKELIQSLNPSFGLVFRKSDKIMFFFIGYHRIKVLIYTLNSAKGRLRSNLK